MRYFLILFLLTQAVHSSYGQHEKTYSSDVRERLYLHTDREAYLVGEMVWFKAYLSIGERHKLSQLSKVIYVEILNRDNESLVKQSIPIRNGVGSSAVYLPYTIKSGGYRIRAYSQWMRNDRPEYYFEKFISIINPLVAIGGVKSELDSTKDQVLKQDVSDNHEQIGVRVTKNKKTYTQRDKVILSIESTLTESIRAQLSLSVHKVDSLEKFINPGIVEYFKKSDLEESMLRSNFIPEYEGQLISGIISACDDESIAGKIIYLYNRGSNTIIHTARANENGEFLFVAAEAIPNPTVLIKPDKQEECYKIDLKEPYSTDFASTEIPPFLISENDLKEISRRSVYMQVYNTIKDQYIHQETQDYVNFFENGYIEYDLDDYTRFDSFETTLREYVSEVSVARKAQQLSFRVRNDQTGSLYAAEPLVLLDGVVVVDHNKLQNIDPHKIDRIQIERKMVLIGEVTFYGVIGIVSKPNVSLRIQNPNEYRLSSNQGSPRLLFPTYKDDVDRDSPKPDFRSLLYWNPDLTLSGKEEIEFYTSDVPGMYRGVIEGMNSAGFFFRSTFYFKVD